MALKLQKLGQAVAKVKNTVDDVADTAKGKIYDVTSSVEDGVSSIKNEYRAERLKNARVQREVEEGTRNLDGSRKAKIKEAKVNTSKESAEAINPSRVSSKKAQKMFDFQGVDGSVYSRQGSKGSYTYHKKGDGGSWQSISSEDYGHARSSWMSYNDSLNLEDNLANAEKVATGNTSDYSSVMECAEDNPIIAAGVIGGAGLLAGGLLFGGDDE